MLGLTLCVALTATQTLSLPMPYHPVMSGFGFAVDAGIDDSSQTSLALAGIATIGHVAVDSGFRLPILNVAASASQFGTGSASGGRSLGLELTLFSSFGLGVNRARWRGVRRDYFPVAAFIPALMCASKKMVFELYVAPVWNFERVQGSTSTAWSPSWGSLSADMILELRSGWGLQMGIGDPRSRAGSDPYHRTVVSLGVHWSPRSILKHAARQGPPGKAQCGFGL